MKFFGINIYKELAVVARFGLVGLLATFVHVVFVWIFIGLYSFNPFVGNTLAFLIAFVVSFSGHYWWTFKSSISIGKAIFRFVFVSLSGFLLNTAILFILLESKLVSDAIAASVATLAVPVFTFILSRFWVFNIERNVRESHNAVD